MGVPVDGAGAAGPDCSVPQAGVAKQDPMVSMGAAVDSSGDAAIDAAAIPAAAAVIPAAAAAAACGQSTAAAAAAVVH